MNDAQKAIYYSRLAKIFDCDDHGLEAGKIRRAFSGPPFICNGVLRSIKDIKKGYWYKVYNGSKIILRFKPLSSIIIDNKNKEPNMGPYVVALAKFDNKPQGKTKIYLANCGVCPYPSDYYNCQYALINNWHPLFYTKRIHE